MKLAESTLTLEKGGFNQETSFSIRDQDMGVILGILRSKMYSDPIGSVVREVTSNAIDSHTAAGIPNKPITIQLPNALSSEFKVIDYGLGLSPDDIDRVYRNYGSSTKRVDNKQIGGFGIGSKSPFAYSDTFSIETIYNGTKYLYSAYIDESDRGKIFLLDSSATQEGNGTTISLPVDTKDFRRFRDATFFYTHYLPIRPKVLGSEISWPEISKCLEGKNWYIFNQYSIGTDHHHAYKSQVSLIVGGIPYPVDLTKLSNRNIWCYLNGKSVVIKCCIGDVSLPATRESLHYDDKTINYLDQRIDLLKEGLQESLQEVINKAPNIWEARLLEEDWYRVITTSFTWRGKVIPVRYTLPKEVRVNCLSLHTDKIRKMEDQYIRPSKNVVLIYNDVSTVLRRDRVLACRNHFPGKHLIFFSHDKGYSIPEDTLPLSGIGTINLSSIPFEVVAKEKKVVSSQGTKSVERKPKGYVEAFMFSTSNRSSESRGMYQFFSSCLLDPKETKGVYVEIKSGFVNLQIGDKLETIFNSPELITKYLEMIGIQELYAFKPSSMDQLGTEWVNLSSLLTSKVEEIKSSNLLKAHYNSSHRFDRLIGAIGIRIEILDLPVTNPLRKYLILSDAMKSEVDEPASSSSMWFIQRHRDIFAGTDSTLLDLYHEVRNKYPLFMAALAACRYKGGFAESFGKDVIKYIRMMDKEYEA